MKIKIPNLMKMSYFCKTVPLTIPTIHFSSKFVNTMKRKLLSIFLIGLFFIFSSNQIVHSQAFPPITTAQPTDVLQWQTDYSLLGKMCEASAGVIQTNVQEGCIKGDQLEVSTNATHQIAEGYTLHYLLLDVTNPNFPKLKKINTTGLFDIPVTSKTYQVYAYSEHTEDAPIPSPLTTPNLAIEAIGQDYIGCHQLVTTGKFDIAGRMYLEEISSINNSTVHVYEICGGELPYTYDFQISDSFANIDEFPSDKAYCRKVRLYYTTGSTWSFKITDASGCNELSYSSANSLLPIIKGYQIIPESCPDNVNGGITLFVEGGIQCEVPELPYTYEWKGPHNFVSNQANLSGIAAGLYSVVVTDCVGNSTSEEMYVSRGGGIIGGRWSRGDCNTSAGKTSLSHSSIKSLETYPNPIVNEAYIEVNLIEDDFFQVQILNFNGQVIALLFEGNVSKNTLQYIPFSVHNLPNGVYFLQLISNKGGHYYEKIQVMR